MRLGRFPVDHQRPFDDRRGLLGFAALFFADSEPMQRVEVVRTPAQDLPVEILRFVEASRIVQGLTLGEQGDEILFAGLGGSVEGRLVHPIVLVRKSMPARLSGAFRTLGRKYQESVNHEFQAAWSPERQRPPVAAGEATVAGKWPWRELAGNGARWPRRRLRAVR